jgi:hypothetical protein
MAGGGRTGLPGVPRGALLRAVRTFAAPGRRRIPAASACDPARAFYSLLQRATEIEADLVEVDEPDIDVQSERCNVE